MSDLFNLVMLLCASLAAMAFGIFLAYGILCVIFALMRPRAGAVQATVKSSPEMARLS
jgi:hypothetical protein